MKLVFPNGEHAQALLSPGANRIGAAANNAVILNVPAMPEVAAVIHLNGLRANLIPNADVEIQVNNRPVRELIALRAGDRLRIAGVHAAFAAVAPVDPGCAPYREANDDSAATRMMAAVPKFSLRGISGVHFGKSYPLTGPVVIGRSPECDIVLAMPMISRRHVQLRPMLDGVLAEDLGSSNGIWINDKHARRGLLQPGDELRIDSNRFLVSVPSREFASMATPPLPLPIQPKSVPAGWKTMLAMIAAGSVITAAVMVIIRIALVHW